MFVSVLVVKLHQKSVTIVKILNVLHTSGNHRGPNYNMFTIFKCNFIWFIAILTVSCCRSNRDEAQALNKSTCCSIYPSNVGKSAPFNADFLCWWGEEGGWRRKHSCHVASVPDKRQPGGSRPGEVEDGEDAQCVSWNPLKAFWWLVGVNSLCAKEVIFMLLQRWIIFCFNFVF